MSYKYTDHYGSKLEMHRASASGNVTVCVTSDGTRRHACITPDEAPALALAVLEAAGIRSEGDTYDRSVESHLIEGAKTLREAIRISAEQAEREADDSKVRELADHLLSAIGSATIDHLDAPEIARAALDYFRDVGDKKPAPPRIASAAIRGELEEKVACGRCDKSTLDTDGWTHDEFDAFCTKCDAELGSGD